MAHLRKKKDSYYGEFRDPNRHPERRWVPLRTKDKRAALQKLTKLERDFAMGMFDPWYDPVRDEGLLLAEAVRLYLKARSDRRPKTLRADRSVLGLLLEELHPDIQLRHVEPRHLSAFLGNLGFSDGTRNTYYTRIKAFFNWCVTEGYLVENPIRKLRPPKTSKTVADFLTREEYTHLLHYIESEAILKENRLKPGEIIWLADVVRFAVGTGMRLGEICNLRWSAVNLQTGYVSVKNARDFKTKSGHERTLYITGEARQVLELRHAARTSELDDYVLTGTSGEQLNATYVSKRFKRFTRMAGLREGVHFHTLRHTYASWLVMAGVDLFRVKELLGHSDISTTQRYAHLAPQHHRDDVERVFGGLARDTIAPRDVEQFYNSSTKSLTVVQKSAPRRRLAKKRIGSESAKFASSEPIPGEPTTGLEPVTCSLRVSCSTD